MTQALVTLLITVLGGALVWGLGYYILLRRLYVVTRYYTQSALSDEGKAVSLTILNRGHRSETDIKLELDPTRHYTLLAVSSNDVSLAGSNLQLTRLPPRANVEAIVLVEGGDFDNDKIIRLTSKEAGGKTFKKLEEAPQSPGVAALAMLFVLGLAGATGFIVYLFTSDSGGVPSIELTAQEKGTAEALKKAGWSNVEDFVKSPIAKPYAPADFPVTIEPIARVEDFVLLDVAIQNKLDEWLTTTINLASPTKINPNDCRSSVVKDYISDSVALPHSKKSEAMVVYVPRNARLDEQAVRASVTLQAMNASVYNVTRLIEVSRVPVKEAVDPRTGKPFTGTCPAQRP